LIYEVIEMAKRKIKLEIKYVPIDDIKPWEDNPKDHNIEAIIASIEEFDVTQPILVQEGTNRIIAGHGRYEAFKHLKIKKIPIIFKKISDGKAKALALVDNQTTMMRGWDDEKYEMAIDDIRLEYPEFNFETYEFDMPEPKVAEEEDEVPAPPKKPKSKIGDLYILDGKHRVMCGDSTKEKDVKRLMGDEKSNVIITSPPYWVGKEYENEKSKDEIIKFISSSINAIVKGIYDDYARIIINTGTSKRRAVEGQSAPAETWLLLDWWIEALRPHGWILRHCRIWGKSGRLAMAGHVSIAPSTDIIAQGWEFIATFYHPGSKHRGQMKISEGWAQQGIWHFEGNAKQESHDAGYPIELPARNIKLYSKKGEIILDPFLGAGTTVIASEQLNRICYGMELDPCYCDIILERYRNYKKSKGEKANIKKVKK